LWVLHPGERLLRDHATVRHHAGTLHPEPLLHTPHHRYQCVHVRGVPGPHLTAHRVSFTIQEGTHHHLLQIRTVVLAVPVLSQGVPSFSLEVDGGRVEEHHVHGREQVPASEEQLLLDDVFHTPGREGDQPVLFFFSEGISEPSHGTVEVLEVQCVRTFYPVCLFPFLACPVGSGAHQPVQHSREHGTLQIESELPASRMTADDLCASAFFPEPLEDQGSADLLLRYLCHAAFLVGTQDHEGLGVPCPGGEQGVQVACFPELVESPQGTQDPLAAPAVYPLVFHHLQVGIAFGLLFPEEHGALLVLTLCIIISECSYVKPYIIISWHHDLPAENHDRGFMRLRRR